ncbi:MAG: cyclic-di-AMP receptor, partial [Clostridia bacterium]|nr:cyclic-di-AMP receptor [Clostridia bacterium]
DVTSALRDAGIPSTMISSTGGFLMKGNSTFISVVDDDDVERAIGIVGEHSRKRELSVPFSAAAADAVPSTGKIIVGGATVFVLNVESCRHL